MHKKPKYKTSICTELKTANIRVWEVNDAQPAKPIIMRMKPKLNSDNMNNSNSHADCRLHWKSKLVKDVPRAARDLRSSNDDDCVSVTDCDNVDITLCTNSFTEFNSAPADMEQTDKITNRCKSVSSRKK